MAARRRTATPRRATPRRRAARGRSPQAGRPSPRVGRRSPRTPVDRLRAICLALPETTEKLAWSEPTWRVRGKLFAQLDDHHHGADHLAVWLPAPLGEQAAMIFTDPERFFRPPYVGPRGWVGVRIDGKVDWSVVATLVTQAYSLVAPPRLRGALEAAMPGSGRSRKS
jgi:predicted DNA-binding protein (MmcQ/YjbR family)